MGIDRLNIPAEYYCEECQPRNIDKNRARQLQTAKRKEQQLLFGTLGPLPPLDGTNPNFLGGAPLPVSAATTKAAAAGQLKANKKQSKSGVSRKKSEQSSSTYGTAKKTKRESATNRLNGKRKELKKTHATKKKLKSADLPNDEKALQTVRGWIENYERAMTNHYAPECKLNNFVVGTINSVNNMLIHVIMKISEAYTIGTKKQ
jgi:hypothetical protein